MNKPYLLAKGCILLSLVILCLSCHSGRQALKLIEKGKYEQAQAKLNKSLSKDSLNPAANYVYSLLYTDTAFQHYHVDSAYKYVLKAISDYQHTEAKSRQKLAKSLQLNSTTLNKQKLLTDSLAFAEASGTHTVTAYQKFIDEHTSSAPQYEEAIRRRNKLAYDAAKRIDTYQAYQYFMHTYPEAVQYAQAQERYNTLVFREKTKGGSLESYLNFLRAFPNSPYRPNVEEQILKISTAGNHLKQYADFARQYPESKYARLAVDILYHLYKTVHHPGHFLKEFPGLPYADSLRRMIAAENKLLVPILENNHYGFMDSTGSMIIPPRYSLISARYLCQGTINDYIHVARADDNKTQHSLLTKDGEVAMQVSSDESLTAHAGPFHSDFITDIGAGCLLVQKAAGKYILRHKAGHLMVPDAYDLLDTVEFVPSPSALHQQIPYQFMKFQVNGLWGLMTFTGKTLLKAEYDTIEEYDAFIVIEKDGKMAVTNRDALIQKANNIQPDLSFLYEDVALVDRNYLLAYTDEYETALNSRLETEVPLGNHTIVRHIGSAHQWLLKKETLRQFVRNDSLINVKNPSYFLYNSQQQNGIPGQYWQAFYNERWLALQNRKGYEFFDFSSSNPGVMYDSVKLLSEHFALLFQKDSVTVRFANQQKFTLARFPDRKELQFRLIKSMANDVLPSQIEYLLIIKGDKKQVVNQQGQSLFAAGFHEITAYQPDLFMIEKNGRKGLVDGEGKTLVPILYQNIGNYKQGMLTVFHNQKFGFYFHNTQTFVKPEYEAMIQFYGPSHGGPTVETDSTAASLFIAQKKGKYGIINQENRVIMPFMFEQIQYWNDAAALVQAENQWQVYQLFPPENTPQEERIKFKGIEDFEELISGKERLLKVYNNKAYGIISNTRGEVIPAAYDEVILLGDEHQHMFLTEKYIPEADLYIMIYFDASGKMLKRQALTAEQYDKIYCDSSYL